MLMKKRRTLRKNLLALVLLLAFFLSACTFVPQEQGDAPLTSEDKVYFPDAKEKIELENGVTLKLSDDKTHYRATARRVNVEYLVIPAEYEGVPIGEVDMLQFEADNVKKVSLPDTIFYIGLSSFNGCTMLEYNQYGNAYYLGNEEYPYLYLIEAVSEDITSVAIHETTRVIAGAAFSHCTKLRDVYIPDSVVNIENIAFYECTYLQIVRFGEGLKRIGGKGFYGCESLREVILPDGITEIGVQCFYGAPIVELDLGESLQTLGEHCFNGARITSVVIPGSLNTLPVGTFGECTGLKKATLREGVEVIDGSAFVNCMSLKEIVLPSTLKKIESRAFINCKDLRITDLPAGIEYIHAMAFPRTVTNSVYGNGYYLGNGESDYAYLISAKPRTELVLHPETEKLPHLLYSNFDLTNVTIKDGKYLEEVNSCFIDKRTGELIAGFDDSVIPDDGRVKSIGYGAFYGMSNLRSVTIPDSVESIGDYAFAGCQSLTEAVIGNGVVSIGNRAFYRSGLQSVSFGSSVAHIGEEAFSDTYITSVVFGDSLISLADKAFYQCFKLTELKLGNSIESIGEWALAQLKITDLVLPASLEYIGEGAFAYCDELQSVSLPGSATEVNPLFIGCGNITEIRFDSTREAWDKVKVGSFKNDVTVIFADGSSIVLPKAEQ